MRHFHVYAAFSLSLLQDYRSHIPPYKPRANWGADANEKGRKEYEERMKVEAIDIPSCTQIDRIEALVFDFDSSESNTFFAVPTISDKPTSNSFKREGKTVGIAFFEWLNELATDGTRLQKLGSLRHDCVSIRGRDPRRLRVQARFEVMLNRKTAFDDISKSLYLQTDTFTHKSVLSGQEAESEAMLQRLAIRSKYQDTLIQELDSCLQLFRRGGLLPGVYNLQEPKS